MKMFIEAPVSRFACRKTNEVMAGGLMTMTSVNRVDCQDTCHKTPACVDYGWVETTKLCYLYTTDRASVTPAKIYTVACAMWCQRMVVFP